MNKKPNLIVNKNKFGFYDLIYYDINDCEYKILDSKLKDYHIKKDKADILFWLYKKIYTHRYIYIIIISLLLSFILFYHNSIKLLQSFSENSSYLIVSRKHISSNESPFEYFINTYDGQYIEFNQYKTERK